MSNNYRGGIFPVGKPRTVAENPWFKVQHQPVDIHDPLTGALKRSAAEGGQMNYVEIGSPGVLIVADLGGMATLLASQERHTTNLVEGTQVRHYELPGGALDSEDCYEADIVAAAAKELGEEMGYKADDYVILGSKRRGLMAHPYIDDRNFTVLARNVSLATHATGQEDTEVIGAPEQFSWSEVHEMSDNDLGLHVPGTDDYKIISSAPTIASLALAERYLHQQ